MLSLTGKNPCTKLLSSRVVSDDDALSPLIFLLATASSTTETHTKKRDQFFRKMRFEEGVSKDLCAFAHLQRSHHSAEVNGIARDMAN